MAPGICPALQSSDLRLRFYCRSLVIKFLRRHSQGFAVLFPAGQALLHEGIKDFVVRGLIEVGQLVDEDVLDKLSRVFSEPRVEAEATAFRLTGAPSALHFLKMKGCLPLDVKTSFPNG